MSYAGTYGKATWGKERYGEYGQSQIAPTITPLSPYEGQINFPVDSPIAFTITDIESDTNWSSVKIYLDKKLIYRTQTSLAGYQVNSYAVVGGKRFEVRGVRYWKGLTQYNVRVYVEDIAVNVADKSYFFKTEKFATCFNGPLIQFEESLLSSYTHSTSLLMYTEQLRKLFLDRYLVVPDHAVAIRAVFIESQRSELSTIFNLLLPHFDENILNVKICYKRNYVEMDYILRQEPGLLQNALEELKALKIPVAYYDLLKKYISKEPVCNVNVACVIIILAKILENSL